MRRRLFGGRDSNHPRKRGKVFVGAALLAAGLALGAGCRSDVEAPQKQKTGQRYLVMKERTEIKSVREGEPLIKENFLLEKNSYFEFLRVDKIDDEGIIVAPFFAGVMSKQTAKKVELSLDDQAAKPFRLRYGENKTFRVGEFALTESLTVKVERNLTPGTATVTLTYSAPFKRQTASAGKGCQMKSLEGSVNLVMAKEGRCEVKEGDELLRVEFLFEKAGYFKFSVGKIDNDGVMLPVGKVRFGETKTFRKGEFALTQSLTVSAERGQVPGTAVLDIRYNGPKRE